MKTPLLTPHQYLELCLRRVPSEGISQDLYTRTVFCVIQNYHRTLIFIPNVYYFALFDSKGSLNSPEAHFMYKLDVSLLKMTG